MKSIKSKIVTIIAIVCVVSVALCSSISYYFSYKAIMAESTNKVSMASQKYSEMINGWLLTKAKLMDSMAVDFQYNNKYDQKYIYSYFQSQLKDNKDVIGMYVGFEDKKFISGNGWIPTKDYDCRQRDWYKEAVKKDGYVVINADDKASLNIIDRMTSKIILFTKNKNNPIVSKYLNNKNLIVYLEENIIYLQNLNENKEIINVNKAPITLGGKLTYNIENIMASIAALIALGLDINTIREGLESFTNEEQNPGRFNMYNVHGTNVILDYGHNIEGYKVVLESVKKIDHKRIIGVIGVPGDRTNSSTLKVGNICGENFDYIYVKEDRDKRGREHGEIAGLLKKGILEMGFKNSKLDIIIDEEEALKKAIEFSEPGDLVIMFFEEFEPAANIVKNKVKKGKLTKSETALA